MKRFIKSITAACIALVLCITAASQPKVYADINISSLSLSSVPTLKKTPELRPISLPGNQTPTLVTVFPDTLKCIISLINNSAAVARGTKLIVMLPAEVYVVPSSLPPNATVVIERGPAAWPGYIEFDLSVVPSNQAITDEFNFSKSSFPNNVSAFVFTSIPDANPANNYKEAAYTHWYRLITRNTHFST